MSNALSISQKILRKAAAKGFAKCDSSGKRLKDGLRNHLLLAGMKRES